jgi:hypothetical protein
MAFYHLHNLSCVLGLRPSLSLTCPLVIPARQGSANQRVTVQASWHKERPYLKNKSAKEASRVDQVVEHLPNKCEARVQTPVLPKKSAGK